MPKLEQILRYFIEVTKNSIRALEQGDLENAELHIKKREEIIEELKLLEYTKGEFQKIVSNLELVQLDKKLENLLKENIGDVKEQLREFNASKEARNNYNKFAGRTPTFINQKI
ncbi:hypothetical protein [Hathewaya limosa]|uniref:Flagellar protein FliT n=1 Tax=Hathewaya limosa TaxID=1536 RepID=A0ABU0JQ89_HATLI|nr:hypothetical protein [Hathewaya limosa]MDQ0479235.1 flagellin-specific chaperone FliS [Hathewaya limosa]